MHKLDKETADGLYAPIGSSGGGGVSYDDTELRQMIEAKYTKPSTGIPASDLASGVISDAVTDGHINSLIDAKLTPLEALSAQIWGVI